MVKNQELYVRDQDIMVKMTTYRNVHCTMYILTVTVCFIDDSVVQTPEEREHETEIPPLMRNRRLVGQQVAGFTITKT